MHAMNKIKSLKMNLQRGMGSNISTLHRSAIFISYVNFVCLCSLGITSNDMLMLYVSESSTTSAYSMMYEPVCARVCCLPDGQTSNCTLRRISKIIFVFVYGLRYDLVNQLTVMYSIFITKISNTNEMFEIW